MPLTAGTFKPSHMIQTGVLGQLHAAYQKRGLTLLALSNCPQVLPLEHAPAHPSKYPFQCPLMAAGVCVCNFSTCLQPDQVHTLPSTWAPTVPCAWMAMSPVILCLHRRRGGTESGQSSIQKQASSKFGGNCHQKKSVSHGDPPSLLQTDCCISAMSCLRGWAMTSII